MIILDSLTPAYLGSLITEIQTRYWSDHKGSREHRDTTNKAIACLIYHIVKRVAYGRKVAEVTLDNNSYNKPLIYNGRTQKKERKISYYAMRRVTDWMDDIGMVEKVLGGVEWKHTEQGFVKTNKRVTELHLSEYLIDMVQPYADKRKLYIPHSMVEMRDSNRKTIPKRLDEYNKGMVKLYTRFNEMAKQSVVTMQGVTIDLEVKKVYNNGSWNQGGRIYAHNDPLSPSVLMKRENRKEIRIDGEPTVELDFKCLHIALLCEQEGIVLPPGFDPYQIQLDGFSEEGARWIGKKASLIFINAGGDDRGEGALREDVRKDSRRDELLSGGHIPDKYKARDVFSAILRHNPYLANYSSNPVGMELQNLDSKVMDRIVEGVLGMGNILIPIHDSIVVKSKLKMLALAEMKKAYLAVMGSDNNCRIEEK